MEPLFLYLENIHDISENSKSNRKRIRFNPVIEYFPAPLAHQEIISRKPYRRKAKSSRTNIKRSGSKSRLATRTESNSKTKAIFKKNRRKTQRQRSKKRRRTI